MGRTMKYGSEESSGFENIHACEQSWARDIFVKSPQQIKASVTR